ncbi:MAG: hypothetical protein J7M26_04755, partial [Armatimonadetes bacterium]|nr:hypothetical protein [Armatimonadota bacterium]
VSDRRPGPPRQAVAAAAPSRPVAQGKYTGGGGPLHGARGEPAGSQRRRVPAALLMASVCEALRSRRALAGASA